ncbi:MAG: ATP-binding protein, partial [Microcystaceae cyanobacterium]
MKLKRELVTKYLKNFDFESLFIEVIQWEPSHAATIYVEVEGELFTLKPIIEKKNITVIQCLVEEIPSKTVIASIESQITSTHLLIIADVNKTEQVWVWKDPTQKKARPKLHYYDVHQSAEPLIQKLEPLFSSFDETATHIDKVSDINRGFNVEQITKQFFQDFEGLHQNFCLEIEGIDNENDRRWYGSVLLNRLMFVYFLQRRYFLDGGNNEYLQDKLKICQGNQESFYDFLKHLFFEGFAKPEYERSHEIQQRLGKICYLNGGLFLRHSIEQKYSDITVSDRAFESVFKLFSGYAWHLNDRPDTEKDANEINPDVLGYIFEKYINQKEFGAYYTRPEITEYLCDRTINKLVLDRSNELGYNFSNLEAVIANLEGNLCDHLLNEVLPNLTLLDPACGSGAFL